MGATTAQSRELAGRNAIGADELTVEMALVAEAGRQGDVTDRVAATHQQIGGALQASCAKAIAGRRA